MHQDSFVRLENLSKSYQEGEHTRVVLRDVNATFARGEKGRCRPELRC